MRNQRKNENKKARAARNSLIDLLGPFVANTPEDLGAAIRAARKRLELLQAEAAGLCNVSPKFLSELEQGKESAHLGKTLGVLRSLGWKIVLQPSPELSKKKKD